MPKPPPDPPIGLPSKGFLRWLGFTIANVFMWTCVGFGLGCLWNRFT